MSEQAPIFNLYQGNQPLLISMPHNGQAIPSEIKATMTETALAVPDTDWYLDKLYDFAQAMGVSVINPTYNRYVIDLNRNTNGENLYPGANSTELCPTTAFDLSPLYQEGKKPTEAEIARRIDTYWQPYHQALAQEIARLKAQHGYVVLLEAHSILSHVPRFFDGQLPDFNFGNNLGESCQQTLIEAIEAIDFSPYSQITNGRFKGGFITRHFGQPSQCVEAVQLELSQATYLDEQTLSYNQTKAEQVKPKLKALVSSLLRYAQQQSQEAAK
ncbi:N-formylglutamate deformylase [Thalassotalea sp. LPB0316]|uniref:N-formylglutamate deformylase n=1 Tax=Thalassotalea sp. LPB0316 TaxID=2769490 RepID=UPI001869237C|nr:N-formylglutamate deformylase [Thalassotalea sp. LPB0316]QOL26187.1 N-formylglutamate deformylase [Thalassotalea sp. LPB0316]